MALMRSTATVPVHVLSGFLGSGKTTLLNRLLAALPAGTRPAIVVNDFGAVTVDGALVDRGRYAVAELASGCVCCTLSAPLQEALSALLDEERPDTILMETTGLAEPAAFPALSRHRSWPPTSTWETWCAWWTPAPIFATPTTCWCCRAKWSRPTPSS